MWTHTTALVSMPLVKLNETNSYKPTQWDQSAIMGEGLTKTKPWKDPQGTKLCPFTFSRWEWQVCVFVKRLRMVPLLCQNPASLFAQRWSGHVALSSHVCSCFLTSTETKEISWGRWNDYDSASHQPLLLPGLPLKSFSHCHQFIPHSL